MLLIFFFVGCLGISHSSFQVDALVALVAAFTPDFKMYWTRENIAHLRYTHISTIWEGCIKCYMPAQPLFYLTLAIVLALCCPFTRPSSPNPWKPLECLRGRHPLGGIQLQKA